MKKKATPIHKNLSDGMHAVLLHYCKSMMANSHSYISDLGKGVNEQQVSQKLVFRKMVLALPTLEDKLEEIGDRYNRHRPSEQIGPKDLDEVAYWPLVGCAKKRKSLSVLTARMNEYIQGNDDNG